MLIIRHREVQDILSGREKDVVQAVRAAYVLHSAGGSRLPHSIFLRLPGATGEPESPNRIIGLPAYLGGDVRAAGIKWISSFPGNLERGIERASAVMILNSLETGRAEAMMEASLISAARTAASAALAADLLVAASQRERTGMTLIGCGTINLTILTYVKALFPALDHVMIHDSDRDRAEAFSGRCRERIPDIAVTIAADLRQAVAANSLISIATTASTPHMDLDGVQDDATVLHVSLRDLTPQTILASQNVADDIDHVCRERTSLHLAEQITGDRSFVETTVGEIAGALVPFQREPGRTVIFSPFGLGVLDLAVARLVRDEAELHNLGVLVDDFEG